MKSLAPWMALLVAGPLAAAGCAVDNSAYEASLREALSVANISLADSVHVAEAETPDSHGIQAALLLGDAPLFSVGAVAAQAMRRVEVDVVTGRVVQALEMGAAPADGCDSAIALADALDLAEARVGGEAVAAAWDDDGGCAREIQVLTSSDLMEVKIGPSGRILEVESSDEDGSGD